MNFYSKIGNKDIKMSGIYYAYFHAVELLRKEMEQDLTENNYLILPAMFLMKHCIEIGIKIIVEDTSGRRPTNHIINELIDALESQLSKEDIQALKDSTGIWNEISYDEYRYDSNKKGKKFHEAGKRINFSEYYKKFKDFHEILLRLMKVDI